MSLIKIPFSPKSKYVQSVIAKLKRENKYHIENSEEVIDICDFFEELLNMVDKEREGRNE
jgi:hypothetical protein